MSLTEIEHLSVNQFKKILENSIKSKSYEYVIGLRGSKGAEMKYSSLKMADYLLPNGEFSITEKRQIFSIRNRMVNIENNFRGKHIRKTCLCGNIEDMNHIYTCKLYNQEKEMIEYEEIFGEDLRSMRKRFNRFQNNLEKREQNLKLNDNPGIPGRVGPLYNDLCSNGNKLID